MATPFPYHSHLEGFLLQDVRLTGTRIGLGVYSQVEEGEMPGAVCAVKIFHKIFQDRSRISQAEIQWVSGRFVEECRLLSTLRHPHIVQFLGIHYVPNSRLPALVMERMLSNLHDVLETRPSIPLALKYSFLYDIAKSICYLHNRSPPLVHRNLSAKNVLLNSDMTAKIGDLCTTRFVPNQRVTSMTTTPNASIYMPPEAPTNDSRYDKAIDIFSLGVVAIFTLTQQFPQKLLAQVYHDESQREVSRNELERREEYMQQIYGQFRCDHPLVQVIKHCLRNYPSARPSIQQVLQLLKQARVEIDDAKCRMDRLHLVLTVNNLSSELESRDRECMALREEVQSKEECLRENEARNNELPQENSELIKDLVAETQSQQTQIQSQQTRIQSQEVQIQSQQAEIEQLKNQTLVSHKIRVQLYNQLALGTPG